MFSCIGKRSRVRRKYNTLWGDREFEREVAKFNQLEGATKKIYKDTRKQGEALAALSKAELRIYQDLATSPVSQDDLFREPLQECTACAERLDELRQELASRNQKTVTDPMKKFSGVFPSVNAAIKRRDQALQDYQKYQAKVLKLQEREKTPQNQAKLDANNQALAAAKLDYERQNAVMLEDLPQLIEGRIDYFEPSFEAMIRSGASYYSQASQVLSDLTNKNGWKKGDLSDEDCQQQLQQKLAEIKSLSIVEDD
ncbi:bridging integrator 3-like isoform X1 [Oculina patagonica]